MNRIRWYGPTVVLVVVVLGTMLAGPWVVRSIAWAFTDASMSNARLANGKSQMLQGLNAAFRNVAKAVEPSVVYIEVFSQTPAASGSLRGLGPDLDDLLPRRERRQPREDLERFNPLKPRGSGSGWVYDDQGHIITNNHVVTLEDRKSFAEKIVVRFQDGTEKAAKVIGADPKSDVAVIQVEGGKWLHKASIAREPVEQGEIVFAFGSPLGQLFSISQGIVSGKARKVGVLRETQGYENFIQTDAAINPGNSGGPLTNIYGEVVGMNSAIATRTGFNDGVGFAIPIDEVMDIAQQLLTKGKVIRGYLGIYINDLDEKMAATFGYSGKGVLVEGAIPGGPAEKSGLKRGDIVTKLDGKAMASADELRSYVARLSPGTKVPVEIFRAGKVESLEVVIGELPDQVARAGPAAPGVDSADLFRRLGLESLESFTRDMAQRLRMDYRAGVLVQSVRPDSAADTAGLTAGTLITEVQGIKVASVEELLAELRKVDLTKNPARLSIVRGDAERFVILELPEK